MPKCICPLTVHLNTERIQSPPCHSHLSIKTATTIAGHFTTLSEQVDHLRHLSISSQYDSYESSCALLSSFLFERCMLILNTNLGVELEHLCNHVPHGQNIYIIDMESLHFFVFAWLVVFRYTLCEASLLSSTEPISWSSSRCFVTVV